MELGLGVASPAIGDISLKTPFFPYRVAVLIIGKLVIDSKSLFSLAVLFAFLGDT